MKSTLVTSFKPSVSGRFVFGKGVRSSWTMATNSRRRAAQAASALTLFEELALPHLDGLYNCALWMTRSVADAEDLVQDTFLRAYKHLDSFQSGSNFKAWIFTILRNIFINRYRKTKTQGPRVAFDTVEEQLPSTATVSANVMAAEVEAALGGLPDDYRITMVLVYHERFTYKEVAEIMDCPTGTVMSRVHRSRLRLRWARLPRQSRERRTTLAHPPRTGTPDVSAEQHESWNRTFDLMPTERGKRRLI